mgnify:FL=1
MAIQAVDSINKTFKGTLDSVDDVVIIFRYGTGMARRGLASEVRDQLVDGYERKTKQDEGKTYDPAFQAILDRHDNGEIV